MHIIVPGDPVPQARARFSSNRGFVRVFDPERSGNYKNYVRAVSARYKGKPMEGPLVMRLDIYKAIPKTWSKAKRQEAINGIIKPHIKPDLSNYLKGIEDALNGIAYVDDAQLVWIIVRKQYSDEPRAEIRIWPDTDDNNEKYFREV